MKASSVVFALITVVLNGCAQVLLRKAALTGAVPTMPVTLLRNAWFMAGLVAYAGSVLTWLRVLGDVPLSVAAPFVALVYVLVPLASRLVFEDEISPKMWMGMVLVAIGVTLVAKGAPDTGATRPPGQARSE